MEFTEENATEIIKKYGMSEKTIKVWKSRGSIPDKYADDDYTPVPAMNRPEKIKLQRMNDILKSEVFNMQVVSELSGVTYLKLEDAIRGKGRIGSDDLSKVIIEIKKIKAFIRNMANAGDVKSLFRCKALKFYVINGKDNWAKQMYYALQKNNSIGRNDLLRLIDNYRMAELKSVI